LKRQENPRRYQIYQRKLSAIAISTPFEKEKKMRSKSILLVVIGFLSFNPVLVTADVGYSDGGVHYITKTITGSVIVSNDGYTGSPTTVYIESGANITNSAQVGGSFTYPGSIIYMRGGKVGLDMGASTNAHIYISGGIVGENYPDSKVVAYDTATIDMTGGSVNWLFTNNSGTVHLSGGTVRDRAQSSGGPMYIDGGQIEGMLRVVNSGHMFLYGSNFIVDGVSVAYGSSLRDYATQGLDPWGHNCLTGNITGSLSNGDSLGIPFYILDGSDIVVEVPEPATLLLFGLGAITLRKRNSQIA